MPNDPKRTDAPRDTCSTYDFHRATDVIEVGRTLAAEAFDALRTKLIPRATVVTPNLDEVRLITGIDVTESGSARMTVDVTCATSGEAHAQRIVEALRHVAGVEVPTA